MSARVEACSRFRLLAMRLGERRWRDNPRQRRLHFVFPSADDSGLTLHERLEAIPRDIGRVGISGLANARVEHLRAAEKSLQSKAKLSTEQAEGFADAIAEALHDDLATKADFLEAELRLEARIEASKSEIVKRLFGTIGFQTLIILGALVALARVAHP